MNRVRKLSRGLGLLTSVALATGAYSAAASAADPPADARQDPGPTGASVAAHLTNPETPTARASALANSVEPLLQDAGRRFGPKFAGSWLEPTGDGHVYVGFAGAEAAAAARSNPDLRELQDHPGVTFVARRYSSAELDGFLDAGASALNSEFAADASGGPWPFTGGVSIRDNVALFEVDTAYVEREAEIRSLLEASIPPDGYALEFSDRTDTQKSCDSRNVCEPIRGGTVLQNSVPGGPGDKICTLGFNMSTPYVRAASTASHCSPSPWYHDGLYIGPTYWTQDSGNVDGKIITIDDQAKWNPSNVIYRASNHTTAVTSKISTPASSLQGNPICQSGGFGGEICGTLTSYNAIWNGRTGFGLGSFEACPGDSGAPVINQSTNRAYGLITGGPYGCAGPNYFMWVSNFEAASGWFVLLVP